jgi:hypothetical protein
MHMILRTRRAPSPWMGPLTGVCVVSIGVLVGGSEALRDRVTRRPERLH